jgi:hypothetical protein
MTIKASAALIFAAGLLMGAAGPLPATAAEGDNTVAAKSEIATSTQAVRHGSRHLKKHDAQRNYIREAAKSDESRKPDEKQVADASGSAASAALAPRVANANAQMTAADAPSVSAKGISAGVTEKADTVPQAADKPAEAETPAEPGAVAADQPNTFDRSLTPSDQPTAATTQGVVLASTSRPSPEQAASNDSSTLDKTSMIGKIFIAVGALLTVASAARMFMA